MNSERTLPPFHLAIPVHDLTRAREFYGDLLGCTEGRSSPDWVDFNFFGHQVVVHAVADQVSTMDKTPVDGHCVPARHFGVVLSMDNWREFAERLEGERVEFLIKPHIRFKGLAGEQATMFFCDPSGNAIELKAFASLDSLFAR